MPEKTRTIFPSIPGPLLFGHRGYSRLAPENTLSAFRLLLEHNIPGVELDIHLCASGELVVVHDHDLKRLCGVDSVVVEESSYSYLKGLDAGSHFHEKFSGEHIPLLEEVFSLLGTNVYYDLELKTLHRNTGELEKKVIAAVKQAGLENRCLISSFNPFSLLACHKLGWQRTAIIYCRAEELPWYLRNGEGRLLSRSPVVKPDRDQVKRRPFYVFRRKSRYQALVWTVDDEAEGRRLLQRGVSGLISNDPAVHLASMGGLRQSR